MCNTSPALGPVHAVYSVGLHWAHMLHVTKRVDALHALHMSPAGLAMRAASSAWGWSVGPIHPAEQLCPASSSLRAQMSLTSLLLNNVTQKSERI